MVLGDEVTEAVAYYPNATDYLVACPASRTTYAGSTTAGPVLSIKLHFYDGATTSTLPPLSRCEEGDPV